MNAPLAHIQAHRFRTYLATIVSSVELLQHHGSGYPAAESDELVTEIGIAAQRMCEMLDEAALARQATPDPVLTAANEPRHG